jgi:hypothetical protein
MNIHTRVIANKIRATHAPKQTSNQIIERLCFNRLDKLNNLL